jgi:hypothetical protein
LLELGLQLEDELSLVKEALLGVELGGAVQVSLVEVIVDVISEGELGFAKRGASRVKAGEGVIALAARFSEGGVRSASAVALLAVTVFIVDAIGAALQALYVGFEPGALGFALGSFDGGSLHEFLVRIGPSVQEGVTSEQLGGEEVGGKAVWSGGAGAGSAVELKLDPQSVLAATEFDAGDVEVVLKAGGAAIGLGDGLASGDAPSEHIGVDSTSSAMAVGASAREHVNGGGGGHRVVHVGAWSSSGGGVGEGIVAGTTEPTGDRVGQRSHSATTVVKIDGSGVEDYRCDWSRVRASAQLTRLQCPYKLSLMIRAAVKNSKRG